MIISFRGPNTNSNEIQLDFSDFKGMKFHKKVDPAAFNMGAVFAHELAHLHKGLDDPPISQSDSMSGPTVDFVNEIRRERGFATRGPAYSGSYGLLGRVKVNFQLDPTKSRSKVYVRFRNH